MSEIPGPDPFISELKRWREVRGYSQLRLSNLMGFDRSYISKIETGREAPTHTFASRAEDVLQTGGSLVALWRRSTSSKTNKITSSGDETDFMETLLVEHDQATLNYDGTRYHAKHQRVLVNAGHEPVTRYLVRIAVDKFPGEPDRSNKHYRAHPLTFEQINFHAACGRHEDMHWVPQHDRDAFKEIWLLFENDYGKFALYPGETTTIEYEYDVSDNQWGDWFQRAVRLPTRKLSIELQLPTSLNPEVWGTQLTLTNTATFQTPIKRATDAERSVFTWSVDNPPLHARYRLEWTYQTRIQPTPTPAETLSPSAAMALVGVVQEEDPILSSPCKQFSLPEECVLANHVLTNLRTAMTRIRQVHRFSKGMGLSASQIGIDRAAAIVQTPEGNEIILLNPTVVASSTEQDEQYEGCLSFFDVRGLVPRPLSIEVKHQNLDGTTQITVFDRGYARLVLHEIDHLAGMTYRRRMREGVNPIPVADYRGTGTTWTY